MIITPSFISWRYKKFNTIPPAVLINYPELDSAPFFEIINPLVEVYDVTLTSAKVRLNYGHVNSLEAGIYSEEISLLDYNTQAVIGVFTVNLNLEDTIVLNVTPQSVSFSFEVGGATPINKALSIVSENQWTISKNASWVTLSETSGENAGTFEIGVVPTGLASGVHTDLVTVDDGANSVDVLVTLTITEANSGTDYLYVNPASLSFGISKGGNVPPQQSVEINASEGWTATKDVAWINLPVASGILGAHVVTIALQNVSGLEVGEYFGNVTFTFGNVVKTVIVQLTVYEFITELLTSGNLYFTDDENNITLSSGRHDTYMKLEVDTLYKSIIHRIPFNIPYFKGKATKRIGAVPKKVIGNQSFLEYATTSLFVPYPILSLNATISEVELFNENTLQTQSVNNIRFLKGVKPINNKLCSLPSKVFLTKNATVYFSILTNGDPVSTIVISGAIDKVFTFPEITNEFLTAIIPLTEVGGLNINDVITISVNGNSIDVGIKDSEIAESKVFWQNKWSVWECFEMTGEVRVIPGYNRKTTDFRKSELQTEEKIIDVTKPISYRVNTGNIYTDEEIQMLDSMLASKNMYLKTNNQVVKVNPTTKKIDLVRTLRDTRAFTLTFNNVLE